MHGPNAGKSVCKISLVSRTAKATRGCCQELNTFETRTLNSAAGSEGADNSEAAYSSSYQRQMPYRKQHLWSMNLATTASKLSQQGTGGFGRTISAQACRCTSNLMAVGWHLDVNTSRFCLIWDYKCMMQFRAVKKF